MKINMGDHENDDPNMDLEEDTAATQNKGDDGQSKLSREERKILQKSYKGLYDQTVDLQDVELQDVSSILNYLLVSFLSNIEQNLMVCVLKLCRHT